MGSLTDRSIKSLAEGTHGDGDGLQLIVSKTGRRKWILRFQMNGKRRDMGLGPYPDIGLADARSAAFAARKLAAQGIDPIQARDAKRKAEKPVPTFQDIASMVIAEVKIKSKNAKCHYQWERYLGEAYSKPILLKPVHEITTLDVAAVLKPVWHSKPGVAKKLHPAIQQVFEHARIVLRDDHGIDMLINPARWSDLKATGFKSLRKLSKGNYPSLPYDQTPAFLAELREREAVAARLLEFLILTNVRTDAAIKATFDQIDTVKRLWIVPLFNLKDREYREKSFRVPLSERALAIVEEMRSIRVSPYLFPGQRPGKPFSNMAMLTLMKRINAGENPKWIDAETKRPICPHGFRATFRTWSEEVTSFPHAVIEEAMGHQVGTEVERAYRRTDVLEKRRALMEAWAAYCTKSKNRPSCFDRMSRAETPSFGGCVNKLQSSKINVQKPIMQFLHSKSGRLRLLKSTDVS